MAVEAISGYFIEIDEIQSNVFDKIYQLEHLGTVELKPGESYEDRRSTLAREANGAIIKIPDLLLVIEIQLKQLSEKEASEALLPEKLTLYIQNWHHLKLRLKASLLEAHSIEMDLIHKQRIAEYVKIEENEGTKEDLFAGRSTTKTPEDPEKKIQDQILTQNKNISSSLQLTKQLMTMSVMQTELNIESIDQQSKDLSQLNDKLMDLEGVLTRSKQIVKFIEKQDKRDKKRIYLSIGFLLCCCAWVMWRRVLKTPVRLLLWSFLQFFGVLNWATQRLRPSKADIQEINAHSVSQVLLSTTPPATETIPPIEGIEIHAHEVPLDETSTVSITSETEITSTVSSEELKEIQPSLEAFVYIEEEVEDMVWMSETLDPQEENKESDERDLFELGNSAIETDATLSEHQISSEDTVHISNLGAEEDPTSEEQEVQEDHKENVIMETMEDHPESIESEGIVEELKEEAANEAPNDHEFEREIERVDEKSADLDKENISEKIMIKEPKSSMSVHDESVEHEISLRETPQDFQSLDSEGREESNEYVPDDTVVEFIETSESNAEILNVEVHSETPESSEATIELSASEIAALEVVKSSENADQGPTVTSNKEIVSESSELSEGTSASNDSDEILTCSEDTSVELYSMAIPDPDENRHALNEESSVDDSSQSQEIEESISSDEIIDIHLDSQISEREKPQEDIQHDSGDAQIEDHESEDINTIHVLDEL